MSLYLSTKERLLLLLDDIEMISKELIENTVSPKHQRNFNVEHSALVDLLISKDDEFKKMLQLAADQEKIEKVIDEYKCKVEVQDKEIHKLQKQLKEAEQILSTALFQARQKLQSISKASKRPVSAEELIKYAHRISASNAVCAPLTWAQGDLRRPYPTDIEMRLGLLGKSEINLNGKGINHQNNITDSNRNTGVDVPATSQNQFAWQMGELHMMSSERTAVPIGKDASQDDVEVMSTDSSSSSSSDSQ